MKVIPENIFFDLMFSPVSDPYRVMNAFEYDIIKKLRYLNSEPEKINAYIPTISSVITQLIGEIEQNEINFSAVEKLMNQDPVLAARVLSLANSVYYKTTTKPIQNLSSAISILGMDSISCIVIALLLKNAVKVDLQHFKLFGSLIWQHSIETAVLCQLLSQENAVETEFNCYLMGLVHDLGKVVVFEYISQQLSQTQSFEQLGCIEFKDELFKHSQLLSVETARLWQLPNAIIVALEQQINGEKTQLADTLFLSNQISESNLMIEQNKLSLIAAIKAVTQHKYCEQLVSRCFKKLMSLPPI